MFRSNCLGRSIGRVTSDLDDIGDYRYRGKLKRLPIARAPITEDEVKRIEREFCRRGHWGRRGYDDIALAALKRHSPKG